MLWSDKMGKELTFQIGEPVIKYKESGSIMDWIKYIKENKRKRK